MSKKLNELVPGDVFYLCKNDGINRIYKITKEIVVENIARGFRVLNEQHYTFGGNLNSTVIYYFGTTIPCATTDIEILKQYLAVQSYDISELLNLLYKYEHE